MLLCVLEQTVFANLSIPTCASSNDAIGDAFRSIKFGFQDVMVGRWFRSLYHTFAIAGFQALTALSTTEDPTRASIPFDKDRNGFVMGEGSGMLVLESLEHAEKRGLLSLLRWLVTEILVMHTT